MQGNTNFTLGWGTLVSHGTFTMWSGFFDASGTTEDQPATIKGAFQLNGGMRLVTPVSDTTGYLVIDGSFAANGGTIWDNLSTASGAFGTFTVNGGATLSTSCDFTTMDISNQPVTTPGMSWNLFICMGSYGGELSVSAPPDWLVNWGDQGLVL